MATVCIHMPSASTFSQIVLILRTKSLRASATEIFFCMTNSHSMGTYNYAKPYTWLFSIFPSIVLFATNRTCFYGTK